MTLPTITATGNVGNDVAVEFTPQGKAKTRLSIGCNETKKTDSGYETLSTTWLSVTFWEEDAQRVADHVSKGDTVVLTGQLLVREYDRQDGSKGTAVEVKYPRISKGLPRATTTAAAPATNQAPDPWRTGETSAPWTQAANDEPPF